MLRPRLRGRRPGRVRRRDAAARRPAQRGPRRRGDRRWSAAAIPPPGRWTTSWSPRGSTACSPARRRALRRSAPARAARAGPGRRAAAAPARRADVGHGRRGSPRLLDDDARARRHAGTRSSSPPTTSTRPTPSPTGSSSWPAAGWSPTARRAEIKAGIAGRTVSFTADRATGCSTACPRSPPSRRTGNAVTLATTDAEATLRALLADGGRLPDLEVRGASLEDAVLSLTARDGDRSDDAPCSPSSCAGVARNRQYLIFTVLLPALFTVFFTKIFGGQAGERGALPGLRRLLHGLDDGLRRPRRGPGRDHPALVRPGLRMAAAAAGHADAGSARCSPSTSSSGRC